MEAFLAFQHLKIQLEEIKSATGNFDNNNVIGKGGFGTVYKGVLSNANGQIMAAFKRLDRSHGQGDTEFWKEILMLSRYTHENLISLLGFCEEDGEKVLVYEHASHGSLDRHLSSTTLTWRQRLKICLAAAAGLCHLHDPKGTQQRVLHRDIKSSNILLDENWNAKVSDLGLSKIGSANQKHTFLVSNVVGTLGYIDPMYMQTSILTKESDVYSFGVVLLEVLCGRLCFENNTSHSRSLVRMWKQSYQQKKLDEVIFQDLKQHMDPRSLETFSDIAFQCLQISRAKRPKMSHVVKKLEIALWFQEISEEVEYVEQNKTAVPPVVNISKPELKMLISKDILVNQGNTLGDIMWRYPRLMGFLHAAFILTILFPPSTSLPALFCCPPIIVNWYRLFRELLRRRPQYIFPKFFGMKTKMSQADKIRDKRQTIQKSNEVHLWHADLQIVAGRIQNMLEDMVIQGERIQALLTWKDQRATVNLVMFCYLACIVLMKIPFQMIAFFIGMYMMRHPRFRNPMPSVPVNFFQRLPVSKDSMM